jgi:hypothetical protein
MRRLAPIAIVLATTLALVACGGAKRSATAGTTASATAYPTAGATAFPTPGATTSTPVPTVANVPQPAVQGQPTVTTSGLKLFEIRAGAGTEVKAGDALTVSYTGWLADGTTIASRASVKVNLTRVIAGVQEGVLGMKVGGKRRLVIPPGLAYGTKGKGNIPPNATLTFDFEIVSIP